MRPGDIIAAVIVTLLAIVTFLVWSGPVCACTLAPLRVTPPAVLDSAMHAVAVAESTLHARRGSYAGVEADLAAAGIPRGVQIVSMGATDSSWHVHLAADVDGVPIDCIVARMPAAPEPDRQRFSSCSTPRQGRSSRSTPGAPSR